MNFKTLILVLVLTMAFCLPYADRMTLANSLIVGNSEDEAWTCKVCDDSNKPIHSHYVEDPKVHVKSIVSVYSDFVVLAFRYTATVVNVWQDILYAFQVSDEHMCHNCKVQREYDNMWNTIRTQVTNDLIDIKRQTRLEKLYITGISLGGGLAVLSLIDIKHANIFSDVNVVTYGAPKVGNKNWAAVFEDLTQGKSRRYIVKGDPIVVLPTCITPLCNYKQTGIKIVCYEKQ
jgi:hypothetical protein